MAELSIDSAGPDWGVFALQTAAGKPVVVRSRLGNPDARQFANDNILARVRCQFPPSAVTATGMPTDTDPVNAFEDELIAELKRGGASTYPIVVVTGDGGRDLYFAADDGGKQLLEALKAIHRDRPFEIKTIRIDESQARLLQSFTPGGAR